MYQGVNAERKRRSRPGGIYLLFDPAARPDWQTMLRNVADAGVRWFQLRSGAIGTAERRLVLRQARALLPGDAVLICNDDVAAAADCDGVHVGPNDATPTEARERLGEGAWIGASCDDPDAVRCPRFAEADYFGAGTWRPTATKPDAGDPISADRLRAVVTAAGRPVFAIGGIRVDDLPALAATGVVGVAVASAIWSAPDPTVAAHRLVRRWRELVE